MTVLFMVLAMHRFESFHPQRVRGFLRRLRAIVSPAHPADPHLPTQTELTNPIYSMKRTEIGFKRRLSLGTEGSKGNVLIGRWSYYGKSLFSGFHNNDFLSIGSFCSISDSATFLVCSGHHFPQRVSNYPIDKFFHKATPAVHRNYTRIGNDVWVGASAILLPGIRVGNGAMIGAGSVVTEDVADFAVVAGNPARFIRWRFDNESIRAAIQSIGWWTWTDDTILARREFFLLPAEDAITLAQEKYWMSAKGIPASYLGEIGKFFSTDLSAEQLDASVREFLCREDSAMILHGQKSLSYENLAVWIALLKEKCPKCIVEFGTQTGCSSTIIARLCRFLGLRTRVVTVNIKNELVYRDQDVEYVIEDLTGRMETVWERWNPDIIFQDAHMYHLIAQQLAEGEKHPHTVHVLHDVGFRLFKNPMAIPIGAVPTSKTGSWERHVLARYAPELLDVATRQASNDKARIHIFDACADSHEYGLGVLKFA